MSRTVDFTSGLQESNAKFNSEVPHSIAPTSVLQPYMPSPNGMASGDAERMMIGGEMRPSANGTSSGTFEKSLPMQIGREVSDPGSF
jgi:hypothetical protein